MLSEDDGAQGESEGPSLPYWYALYTHSHCEQLLYNQLLAKGFHAFLPKIEFGRAARARTGREMSLSCPPEPSAAEMQRKPPAAAPLRPMLAPIWRRCAGRQCLVSAPMFPSNLFLRHTMDKISYIQVRKARGLVRILGERWGNLFHIDEGSAEYGVL